jgi:cytochrome c-type biogenesis protein CcsB
MKYLKLLFTPAFMGIMLVLFALSMAVATFVENDFGSAAAYSFVYNTTWFELILLLLVVNLTGQIFEYKLYRRAKLTVLFFHLAFVIMIIGAAITRYFGYEGSIHIREGQEENSCFSSVKYIGYSIKDEKGNLLAENSKKYSLTSRTADNYRSRIKINGEEYKVVLSKIIPNAAEATGGVIGIDPSVNETGKTAFIFDVSAGNQPATLTLWNEADQNIAKESFDLNGKKIELFYGSKVTVLPFKIKLNDFILERYPGSNSPSGYKSDVILIDKASNTEKPFMIFMNNILKYRGYRFYQSSFDKDEKGTILSLNQDNAGMFVSYSGYCLLFLFIILSIVNRKSIFHNINPGYWTTPFKKIITVLIFIFLLSGGSIVSAQKLVPDKKIAEDFGKVLVQDQKGRTKPLFTLSNDILRKVSRENDFDGMTSMQIFLGLYLDFEHWRKVPLIKISNRDIQNKLGVKGSFASFSDLVDLSQNGSYKLVGDVNNAYNKAPGERNKYDKEVIKIDERVNIIYMVYTGEFFKLFPLKNETHSWGQPAEALKSAISREDSLYLNSIIPMFTEAVRSGNLSNARQIIGSISAYQKRFAGYRLPSESRTNAELFYYKSKIFERLFPFYATVGLIMLIGLIVMVISGRKGNSLFIKGLGWLLFAGFLFHTIGLGLRWYIAGHSPMSNGYESMIFISWVTLLAGFIFSRKSAFALSATAVLGAMTLMVAHLSFMDPEITNLVPVLKSYWLTLHVSVITGSYGFLGLGAILGLINMILLALSNPGNHERIGRTIEELTVINYKTLTLGLYFLTIGTFLGAVWANESWGRYWGWDPKETWSLITVIIYSLVIHSRMIPSLKDIYSFNILSLFAFSCVLMTYFGVNYYLSGMHSYASGDPVPVPSFVYITVILLAALSLFAYFKYTNWKKSS